MRAGGVRAGFLTPERGFLETQSLTARRLAVLSLVLLFFFVSGACGLVYQVVWTRWLVLLVGARAHAVAIVLSVFFLGLGLGSRWGGRFADRTPRPLWWYGVFEVLIGVWAVGVAFAMGPAEGLAAAVLRAAQSSPAAGVLARAVMAAVLLLPPVTLMGATLPLLARHVTRDPALGGRRVGLLYALNTFGAAAGCFLAGFVLIQRFGYLHTTWLAAAANAAVAAGALLLARFSTGGAAAAPAEDDTPPEGPETGRRTALLLTVAFGVTGFSALAMEVIWTRLLAMVFLGTTYAFTTMLTALLCGIALGGLAGAALLSRRTRFAVPLSGALLLLLGLSWLCMIRALDGLPARAVEMQAAAGNRWELVVRGMFLHAFLLLLPPAFLSGMLFPALVRAVSRSAGRFGRDVGRLYAVNTLGGVLGSLAGGFVLLPLLGAQHAMTVMALAPLPFGLAVLWGRGALMPRAAALLLAASSVHAFWSLPADINRRLSASYMPKDHETIFYREGVEGTVAVSQPKGGTDGSDRVLWINRVQATTSIERGVKMNRLQGALPLLFDRDPKRVLFMCFGSGITCGTLALTDFERIDAVEICPEVLEAAPLFAKDNLGVLERPGIRFVVDDARNFLLTTRETYDVITFEPMPLALAGVSNFYTEDYYRRCLARLAPGGVVSQWVPLHSLNAEVVASLVFTFTRVFPEYCAFFVNADLFLMGSDRPLRLDLDAARRRLARPELAAALAAVDLGDPVEVMGSFLMDKAAVDRFAAGGRVMRDDLPWAEFIAPRLVYARAVPESLERLRGVATPPTALMDPAALSPEDRARLERRHRSRVLDLAALKGYYGGFVMDGAALEGFIASLREDPDNPTAKYYLRQILGAQVGTLVGWREPDKARAAVEKAAPWLPGDPLVEKLQADIAAMPAE